MWPDPISGVLSARTGKDIMSIPSTRPALDVNGKLLGTGAVLLAVGGAVLMTGAALASVALAQAAKKWIDQLEESPTVLAQRQLHHLRVAAQAGSKAWRDQRA